MEALPAFNDLQKGGQVSPLIVAPNCSRRDFRENIFTGALSDRLLRFSQTNSLLSEWQRAFIGADGCSDCNLALDAVRDHERINRRQLHLCFLDISNAFGSVVHPLLFEILIKFGIPQPVVSLIQALYSDSFFLYNDGSGLSEIPERVGVKQGDPLSPLLFNFYIYPAIIATRNEDAGYALSDGLAVRVLAFADDTLLIFRTRTGMRLLLEVFSRVCTALGLSINANKSVSRSVTFSSLKTGRVLKCPFVVNGLTMPQLPEEKTVRYLGRPFGLEDQPDPSLYLTSSLSLARAIADSHLSPWQKLDALQLFVISRFHFLMRVGDVRMIEYKDIDRDLRALIRRMCSLPRFSSSAYIEGPSALGCLGFPSLVNT